MMRRSDRMIPWAFAAGFAVVVAVNAVLIVKAIGSFTGLETARAYDRGLAYNAALAAAERQRAQGWKVGFDLRPQPAGKGAGGRRAEIEARFAGPDGRALTDLDVRAMLTRPVRAGDDTDRTVALDHRGGGVYSARVELPLAGQWDLRVVAADEAGEWQDRRRFYVP